MEQMGSKVLDAFSSPGPMGKADGCTLPGEAPHALCSQWLRVCKADSKEVTKSAEVTGRRHVGTGQFGHSWHIRERTEKQDTIWGSLDEVSL